MIIVMTDARTRYFGSMYSTSVTIGDWERFIAEDVVGYVDQNYRTLARRESRGIAGHSMGGYGAVRIGMKRPDVFSSLYSLSACCLINDPAIFAESGANLGNLFVATVSRAAAAAWSPNPANAPEYFDRPGEDDVDEAMIAAKWAANSPLAMIDQYVSNLRRYTAIALDVGSEDELRSSNEQLAGVLEAYELGPEFEIYQGDHADRIAERIEERVIPFFSQHLVFE
jgi:S-formylglutathione hydrolase FrmB